MSVSAAPALPSFAQSSWFDCVWSLQTFRAMSMRLNAASGVAVTVRVPVACAVTS